MPSAPRRRPGSRRAILTIAISAIALETALLGMVAPLLPENIFGKRVGAQPRLKLFQLLNVGHCRLMLRQ